MCQINLSSINQFVGHKVELCLRSDLIQCSPTYTYERFNWGVLDEELCLKDEADNDCRTYLPINELSKFEVDGDDLYSTVISLSSVSYILMMCCAESRPVKPKCIICKKEIDQSIENIHWLSGCNGSFVMHENCALNIIEEDEIYA